VWLFVVTARTVGPAGKQRALGEQPQRLPLKTPLAFARDKGPSVREKAPLSQGRASLSLWRGCGDDARGRREAQRARRRVPQPDGAQLFGRTAASLKGQSTKHRDARVQKKT